MAENILIGEKKLQYYNNLLIRADLNLHQQIAKKVEEILPPGSRILDLGAGQGALSARLHDLGYKLIAVDVDPLDFKCETVEFHKVDFNNKEEVERFKTEYHESFDLVLGIEVIEHIENPWEYVRLLKGLVKPKGFLIISTPNITSWISRFKFLLSGQFFQFDEPDLAYGHIAPITPWELNLILTKEGFKKINITKGGTLPKIWIRRDLAALFINFLALIVRPFSKGIVDGWCIIATAQK
ncbi:class I SAM-dependent methyltransferase [Adhaeribacter pallidiroseus]|uniref:Polyprenyldihydroxybenzoate methyltransferase n=1 Tax=Adhaeribacter pallidiroseus TaxID=2072847 RepID=A0A369QIB0_9BACT|nr:methyltransferase domain-containing protein [Adhaeribacter pallidiroseus]RDC62966.1 Polyprenyldihydroxybenzoate methyltransferase [Adhaeribacter pallidiroseus]